MGMNGCAGIYPALMAVTIANMAGVEMNEVSMQCF